MKVNNIATPALVLDLDAMERNMALMNEFLAGSTMKLRPHYKSHKCTALAHRQMAAGAKGLCCAKVSEAADLIEAGVEDVLLANQVVDPAKIAQLASLAGCCRLTVCVDEADNIRALNAACALQNTTLYCLVEYDLGMRRCGVATHEEVLALAQLVEQQSHLRFEGIQAYAGQIAHLEDFDRRKEI